MPLDPAIASAGLGVVGGIIGKIGQRKQQRRNIRQQTAANKELAEYAYGKDLEQWERQNLYNAPTQQMSRLREAGLNPNLIYGTGTNATQSQATSPKYQNVRSGDYSQQQSPLQALDMLGQFQDFKMKNAQIFNTEQEGKLKEAEAEYANPYYWARMRGSKAGFNKLQMENIFRSMDGKTTEQFTVDGIKRNLTKSVGFKRYQKQVESLETSNQLKRLEAAWFEKLKAMGILRGIFGLVR